MASSTDETRIDGFLGGRLRIAQPVAGYRAGMDAVMLAAACPAGTGDTVLEVGCGAGVAALCLAARVPGVRVTGLEVQAEYAALARSNAEANQINLELHEGDLRAMPAALRERRFDYVIMNPPFFVGGTVAAGGRGVARHEDATLDAWIASGLRRLRPGGWLVLIQRADRLSQVLSALDGPAGDLRVLPVAPRTGRAAGRVIVAARRGARGPLRLLAPFILHAEPVHQGDAEDLSQQAQDVLRHGGAISLQCSQSG